LEGRQQVTTGRANGADSGHPDENQDPCRKGRHPDENQDLNCSVNLTRSKRNAPHAQILTCVRMTEFFALRFLDPWVPACAGMTKNEAARPCNRTVLAGVNSGMRGRRAGFFNPLFTR
jgi:hypothetical protein